MMPTETESCAHCGGALVGEWEPFVMLPGDDVPRHGSRTEIVVTPGRCLRVEVRSCEQGHLALRRER